MVECFSNKVRRCCVKVVYVEEGEGWKAYIQECFRQLMGEGHQEDVPKEQVEFPKGS